VRVEGQYAEAPSGGCVTILLIMLFFMMVSLWLAGQQHHRATTDCPPLADTATCIELLGSLEDER
jgi:hypothetical protein